MMETQLFFLLPEYKDKANTTHFFLETERLMSDEELAVYMRKLKIVVMYMKDEEVSCFYDNQNIQAFLYPITIMPDEYPAKRRYQMEFMERYLECWRDNEEVCDDDRFFYRGTETKDNTLCEIAKRQYNNRKNRYIVVSHEALNTMTGDSEKLEVRCNGRKKVFRAVRADVNVLLPWLRCKGVIIRKYHPNTAKHGDSGLGGSQASDASPLLCSNKKAKKMMGKALKVGRELFFFDKDHELYIRYMNGGNDTFHPFHIVNAQDEAKNVPSQAKSILRLYLGEFKSKLE